MMGSFRLGKASKIPPLSQHWQGHRITPSLVPHPRVVSNTPRDSDAITFPGQHVPMLNHPFHEEIFPNIRSKLPLAQPEALFSRPVAHFHGSKALKWLNPAPRESLTQQSRFFPDTTTPRGHLLKTCRKVLSPLSRSPVLRSPCQR